MNGLGIVLLVLAAASPDTRPGKVLGEVASIEGPRLTVRVDGGPPVVVTTDEATRYVKTQPGAATLEGAQTIALAEVAVADRVLAAGTLSADGATLAARQVVVMSRGDIAAKQERERAEWRKRGTSGVVTAVDAGKQEVTIRARGGPEAAPVVISTAEKKAVVRRYAPGSVKFSDAQASELGAIEVGDQVRALGDRSEDGRRLVAEQVVSGAFRTLLGAVAAVDADKGELRLTAGPKETVTVTVGSANLRRLPKEMAAKMIAPGAKGPAPNLGDLLEKMPAVKLEDLKAGDRVAVSSTRGSDPSRVTAIAVVAGIEPLLAPPTSRASGPMLMPGLPGGAMDMGMGGP
jgi:hypothetical protein